MMEDPGVDDLSQDEEEEEADDETAMALAAAEAAAAAEEQEQQQLAAAAVAANNNDAGADSYMVCRICGKGPDDDGRPLCRFLPTNPNNHNSNTTVNPGISTFTQDISLHVFCGKTASILPNVNQPELEILSKAGIKNKHGIGPEVNGALARTRSCTIQAEGVKEKTFYIVKEFEGHLAAIRSASLASTVHVNSVSDHQQQQQQYHLNSRHHHLPDDDDIQQHHQHHHNDASALGGQQLLLSPFPTHAGVVAPLVDHSTGPVDPAFDPLYHHSSSPPIPPPAVAVGSRSHNKLIPHKASSSYNDKYTIKASGGRAGGGANNNDPWIDVTITPDGKIRCGCGGTHLPTGSAKGDASWRSHVMTKRHQKWMEENGLLGVV